MKRKGISAAVAAAIIIVALGVGASAYYIGAVLPPEQNATTMATSSSAYSMATSANTMIPAVSSTAMSSTSSSSASTTIMMSSSTRTTSQPSSGQGAQLHIAASKVAHSLSGMSVSFTCGPTEPAQGASYLQVTNTGTAPSDISNISFNYVDMGTESGGPTGACTVGAGATLYVTFTGIGQDMASAGEMYTVSVTGSNGGFTYADTAFG